VKRSRTFLIAVIALAGLLATAKPSAAHEMSMAEMQLRETAPGTFLWQWTSSGNLPAGQDITPIWPAHCEALESLLRCAPEGLRGALEVDGVGARYSAALVKIFWLDGQSTVHTLTSAQPVVQLFGSADDRRGLAEIAGAYGVLGVEHILSGFDHLLFVLALLFLVGFNRRLVLTITAFTVAHSLTLALSALGWLTLRPPPVEATIALSIALVAAEALNDRPTLARRWPALVAFMFGLVHGLGFAGALREIGLPQNHLPAALLTFNLGVEAGQLLVVAAAYVVCRAFARTPALVAARAPALYAIGAVAAYWSIGRLVALVG
jgi:hydrogenase/urease accessory protein HupE